MTSFEIRHANSEDADGIAQLISALGYPSTPEQIRARLAAMAKDGRHATFVALSDQRPVGMTAAVIQNVFEQDEPIGRIIALSVDSDFQRTGLGTALIKEAERWIRLQGGSMVLVNSGYHRNDAHQFYEYAGYVAKGTSFRKTL